MKLLLLDIEVAPNLAYVWKLRKEFISLDQLVDSSYMMSWSAKWYGEPEIMHMNLHKNKKAMVKTMHKLLDEADAVIHYNGAKFDIPILNKEFLLKGLTPPSHYRQIDLLTTARNQFRFPSNKLDYVAKALGFGGKTQHEGFRLWLRCMNGEAAAWEELEAYNNNDVDLLEKVYDIFKPWIKNHPNVALYREDGDSIVCPRCGGSHLTRRGFSYTAVGKYQRYHCKSCGAWSRDRSSLTSGPELINA